MLTMPNFMPGLLFPGVARLTPPETLRIVKHGPAHMLPVPAGTVAFRWDAAGEETSEPVAACRAQLFAQTRQNGEPVVWLVEVDPIAADGKVISYSQITFAHGAFGYYIPASGDDPDELLRRALEGGLFVDLEEMEDELDEEEDR